MQIESFDQYDAVFFDLDGTLYDDRQYDSGAYSLIAQYFRDEPNLQSHLQELKRRRGRLDGSLFDDYCRQRRMADGSAAKMTQIYRDFVPESLQIDPHMEWLLQQLASRKLFLITNGRATTQEKKIKALQVEKWFSRIYICDGREWPLKPDPAVYTHAQAMFAFDRAVMVGDSLEIDREFASNAGIDFFHYSVVA